MNFHLNKAASSVTVASESADRDTNLENFESLTQSPTWPLRINSAPMDIDEQQRQAKKRPLRNSTEEDSI